MTTASEMSEAQREIYNLVQQGITPQRIADRLGKDLGIVNAQITRLRTKGILPLPTPTPKPATEVRPTPTGPTSNEAVAREIEEAGPAKYEIPDELRVTAEKHSEVLDVHPMVLLGVTIQYVKMCGGRMHAHQVIEDVYGALQTITCDTPDDKERIAMPFPTIESERNSLALKERINQLEVQLNNLKSTIK